MEVRTRRTWGEVIPAADLGAEAPAGGVLRVLVDGDEQEASGDRPAQVFPDGNGGPGFPAAALQAPAADAAGSGSVLYFALDGAGRALRPGEVIPVELSLDEGEGGTVIPHASLVYDHNGATWAYTNPEPLVFLRQRISIAYVEGEDAVLSDGPAAGTTVVTTGAAELYGLETGVGK